VPQPKKRIPKKARKADNKDLFTTEEIKQINSLPEAQRNQFLEENKMIKIWDGYKYRYTRVPIKVREPLHVPEYSPEKPGFEPDIIHYSKQNGYRSMWYDATNAVHPRV
jgi:hypothetical protein